MKLSNKNIVYIFLSTILLVGVFISGVYLGYKNQPDVLKIVGLSNKDSNEISNNANFSNFWKVWNTIDQKFPDSEKVTAQDRVYGAISGLLGSLNDPYTEFFNKEESKAFDEQLSGQFVGVGMELGMKDKILTVIAPLKNTPAYQAGIKSGDQILKINNKSTENMSVDEAIKNVRGEEGTVVKLLIYRKGESKAREISITRAIIHIPNIETTKKDDGIFVIRLNTFSENSSVEFANAINEYFNSGYKKMVLDLRGNPGGFLESAVDIASWFLPSGSVVVREGGKTKSDDKVYRSAGHRGWTQDMKMSILVDGGSASASEILAGALSEHHVGQLVGEQTFGKGSVQEYLQLNDDTSFKITVAKWYTPNGISISEKGITPDYKIEISEKDAEKNIDTQMNKAIELLK